MRLYRKISVVLGHGQERTIIAIIKNSSKISGINKSDDNDDPFFQEEEESKQYK